MKWLPDRKWLASGLSGIITWALISFVLPEMDTETAAGLVGGVMAVVHYLVPPSVKDILKRIDDTIIGMFQSDQAGNGMNKGPDA